MKSRKTKTKNHSTTREYFSVDQWVLVPTTCSKPTRFLTMQIHHEPNGVRIRLVDDRAATWWEFLEAPSVQGGSEVR